MDFLSFCLTVFKTKQLTDSRYSLLFDDEQSSLGYFHLLQNIFSQSNLHTIETIQLQPNELETVCSMLSMTFLGEKKVYWVHGLQTLSSAEQKKYLTCLQTLHSEHVIFLVIPKDIPYGTRIAIKPELTRSEALTLTTLIATKEQQYFFQFFDALKNKGAKIIPEDFNLLLAYSELVGHKSPEFFKTWMPRIFSSQKSLFQLSQAFFAKETKLFLALWRDMYEQYSIAFWSIFFSEQIFKAALFVRAQKMKKAADAGVEHRLPFSFLKKDWRLHSADALIDFHQSVCDFDIAFKNGEKREEFFELLCLQYMSQ